MCFCSAQNAENRLHIDHHDHHEQNKMAVPIGTLQNSFCAGGGLLFLGQQA